MCGWDEWFILCVTFSSSHSSVPAFPRDEVAWGSLEESLGKGLWPGHCPGEGQGLREGGCRSPLRSVLSQGLISNATLALCVHKNCLRMRDMVTDT